MVHSIFYFVAICVFTVALLYLFSIVVTSFQDREENETPLERTKSPRNPWLNSDFLRSIIVTLVLILGYRFGTQISLPYLKINVLKDYSRIYHAFDSNFPVNLSLFSLGVMPYIFAYMLIEIFSLFVPPLKRMRMGSYKGRRMLKTIALIATLFLGVLEATSIINVIKTMAVPNGTKILEIGFGYKYYILIGILVGGVFLLVTVCELISRYGVGNGISVLIMSGICAGYYQDFHKYLNTSRKLGHEISLIPMIIFTLVVLVTIVLLKGKLLAKVSHKLDNEPVSLFEFNFCPSSKEPLGYASSIVFIPATLANFMENGSGVGRLLYPGSLFYSVTTILLVFLLSYLLAWLFSHPKSRIEKMKERGWKFSDNRHTCPKYLLKKIFLINLPWTMFLSVMSVVPYLLKIKYNFPSTINGAYLPLVAAVCLDLLDRFNFAKFKSRQPIKIAEIHDIYDASMIRNHLRAKGIVCHLQGYYHRHLLYFFGPYIDISIMVSSEEQKVAVELIEKYHGGLGLLVNR